MPGITNLDFFQRTIKNFHKSYMIGTIITYYSKTKKKTSVIEKPSSWMVKLNVIKMSVLQKLIYKFKVIQPK